MPNKKSAARRVRNSERKQLVNKSVKSTLRNREKKFLAFVEAGKTDDAKVALSAAVAALDKAAKKGVIHRAKADRKKSRLSLCLNRATASATV